LCSFGFASTFAIELTHDFMDANKWIADVVFESQHTSDPLAFRRWLLARLREVVPFESAILLQHPVEGAPPAAINKEQARHFHGLYVARPFHYRPSLDKGRQAAATSCGAYLDTEVYSLRERDALPFYSDIVRPQKITSQIHALLTFGGRPVGSLFLCRHGVVGNFAARDVDRLRALIPAISVVQAAMVAKDAIPRIAANDDLDDADSDPAALALARLSPRERTLAEYVTRGLHNSDIAHVLGTSPNTVRNQLARMYAKLEMSGRAELAALFAEKRTRMGRSAQ
jgi:DNA-binding CsgD family transcriptional regulator